MQLLTLRTNIILNVNENFLKIPFILESNGHFSIEKENDYRNFNFFMNHFQKDCIKMIITSNDELGYFLDDMTKEQKEIFQKMKNYYNSNYTKL